MGGSIAQPSMVGCFGCLEGGSPHLLYGTKVYQAHQGTWRSGPPSPRHTPEVPTVGGGTTGVVLREEGVPAAPADQGGCRLLACLLPGLHGVSADAQRLLIRPRARPKAAGLPAVMEWGCRQPAVRRPPGARWHVSQPRLPATLRSSLSLGTPAPACPRPSHLRFSPAGCCQ